MGGIVSICVGRRKTGKTTFSKKMLDKKPLKMPVIIYDINQEYKNYYKGDFLDFDIFLDKIVGLRHHYILIEEATIFFNPRGGKIEQMTNLLVRARHTGNIIQLNFHSFASIPKDIKNLIDYVTIFKTNDNINDVKARIDDEKILRVWQKIKDSSNPFEYEVCSIY